MAEALGDPSHDPHGSPIPTPDGVMARTSDESLAEAPLHEPLTIQSVRDHEADSLRAMEAMGLVPGVRVEVLSTDPGRPIELRVAGGSEPTSIPRRLAESIFVQKAP